METQSVRLIRFHAFSCQWLVLLFLEKMACICMEILVLQSYVYVTIYINGLQQTVGTAADTYTQCLAFPGMET